MEELLTEIQLCDMAGNAWPAQSIVLSSVMRISNQHAQALEKDAQKS